MNRKLFVFIFLSLFVLTLSAQNNGKEKIAVLDFDSTSLTEDEARLYSDQIASYISEIGIYTVLERNQLEKVLKEYELSFSGLTVEGIYQVGQMLSADYLVIGNVGNIGQTRHWANIKLIDVETAETVRSIAKEYRSLPELLDDTRNLIKAFLDPGVENSGDYIITSPSDFSSFDFIGPGYVYYREDFLDGSFLNSSSLDFFAFFSRGREIGIFWDCSVGLPVVTDFNGAVLQYSDYNFNFAISINLGVSTLLTLSKKMNIITGVGLHMDQHQFWPDLAAPDPMVINLGITVPLNIVYRYNINSFIGGAVTVSYDFIKLMTNPLNGKSGFRISVNFIMGRGK